MIAGNIYINGQLTTPDDQGNVILSYFQTNILESLDTITITPEGGQAVIYSPVDDNPVYINLGDVLAKYIWKDADDVSIQTRVMQYVEKSSYSFAVKLSSGLEFTLWMVMSSKYPDFCESTFYGGEDQDIYIYFFAEDGENPEVIDVDDTAVNTIEVYAADNIGPRFFDTDSQEIEDWDDTRSLDDDIGATFFAEENMWYPAKPMYERGSGIQATIVSGTYPHSDVATTRHLRQPIVKWVVDRDNVDYEKYWGNPCVMYDLFNWDFSSNIGGYIKYSGELFKIVDAFDARETGLDYTVSPAPPVKHYVILDRPICANFGIRPYYQGYGSWNEKYAYEDWNASSSLWDIYDYYGELTRAKARDRLKKFLVYPEYSEYRTILPSYARIPNEPKLYTFDYDANSLVTLTLNVNNDMMGSCYGAGQYEPDTQVSISATANAGYMFVEWSDGNTNATRTITVSSSMTLTATFAVWSPIPSGYQLVEYIQGTGNPRISTLIQDSNIGKIECYCRIDSAPSTGNAYNGTYSSSPSPAKYCGFGADSNDNLIVDWGANVSPASFGANDHNFHTWIVDPKNGVCSLDGSQTTLNANANAGKAFYLFNANGTYKTWTVSIYRCKIWNQQDELVRDLLAVRKKDGTAVGMYDLVSNDFFGNIYVGTFTAGPDKQWQDE